MEKISQEVLNSAFSEMLDSDEGAEALRSAGASYIRMKLREESFARKILPAERCTKHDLQRNTKNDSLVKIVDIEPNSTAISMDFRGESPMTFVEGGRYEIPFFLISTPEYSKTEEELLAYEAPVVEIVERNSVKDIQTVEDETFLSYVNAALVNTNQWIQVDDTIADGNFSTLPMQSVKYVTRAMRALEEGNQLVTDCILMSKSTYLDLLGLPSEQVGTDLRSETFKDGYIYGNLMGKKLIVTVKEDLVPYGAILCFAAPEFLGNFYVLGNTKFWIDKRANVVSWKTWENIGVGIGNVKGIGGIFWNNSHLLASAGAFALTDNAGTNVAEADLA
mgnify:CR=1 FL=1|jgi:hypothetical protein